jgi:PHP domain-containing protein
MDPSAMIGVVHVHSAFSHDGHDAIERVRETAIARGVQFVAMSDHAEDFDAERFDALVAQCHAASDGRVLILPGLEFRFAGFKGLHLLALGLRHWIAPRTPDEFAAVAPGVSGLTVVAHPGLAGYAIPPAVSMAVDAIEVWNAAYNTRYLPDPRAIGIVRDLRRGRPAVVGVAGLDQHDASNDRQTRVVLDHVSADPLGELRAGRFQNRGATLTFGADGDWSPAALTALTVARAGLDVIERTQQRWALARRRRSRRRNG